MRYKTFYRFIRNCSESLPKEPEIISFPDARHLYFLRTPLTILVISWDFFKQSKPNVPISSQIFFHDYLIRREASRFDFPSRERWPHSTSLGVLPKHIATRNEQRTEHHVCWPFCPLGSAAPRDVASVLLGTLPQVSASASILIENIILSLL